MTPPVVLTVAGSDSGGGAGIQADLKTFAALGVYGTSVVTAITAQNSVAVLDVHPVPAGVVGAQLDAVLGDFDVRAVKVGMLANAEIAEAVAVRARAGRLPHLVLDPVLAASTGRRLGMVAAVRSLVPYATVLTPNREEASVLLGRPVTSPAEMARAARDLADAGPRAVVVTGGDDALDVLWTGQVLTGPRISTGNTHGTGCTFSSAIAARLAAGDDVIDAVSTAKQYVTRALDGARDWVIGTGAGPLHHFA